MPFRRLFRPIRRQVPENAAIVTAYTDGEVTLRANRSKIGYHEAASLDGYQGVEPGDFVVHGLDIMRGSVGVSDSRGAISSVCTICVPLRELDLRYVAYLIREQAFSGFPKALARGVRDGGADFRRWDTLAELPIPVVEVGLQRAIAEFLDRETAEIDEFVAESEKLITLLNERRAAVITQAVTKGLDPTAPMKDTGIEWLGQIPAHWQVVRVKHLAELLPGYAFPSSVFAPENSGPKLLRGINLGVGKLDWTDLVQVENKFGVELEEYRLDLGDLVLGMDRPIVSDGLRLAEIDEQAAGALLVQRVLRIRSQTIGTRMLSCALNSRGFLAHLEPDFTGVSVPHISEAQVGRFAIPVAPENERVDILEFLEIQTAKIDEAIATALGAIALAKERRQALISAAVTGKIDVRAAA